jgi:hypothetical protein
MMDLVDAFGGGSDQPEAEPAPTRDDAADALASQEEKDRQRRALLAGRQSTMLSGAGGVPSESTGTRMLTTVNMARSLTS